jgi:choline kinase
MQVPSKVPQAIVLAAGRGRRMRPLSDSVHKALLPIGDTTILDRILDGLVAAGVSRITIVTGYRVDDVRSAVAGRRPHADVRFVHNDRFLETNNIASLGLALDDVPLDRDVVLVECDLLVEPELLRRLCLEREGNVALLDRYETGMDGTVVTVQDGVVTRVIPPEEQDAGFRYEGTFKT